MNTTSKDAGVVQREAARRAAILLKPYGKYGPLKQKSQLVAEISGTLLYITIPRCRGYISAYSTIGFEFPFSFNKSCKPTKTTLGGKGF